MENRIEVVPFCDHWAKDFEQEAKRIRESLGRGCHQIYHVGSTSILGVWAKPIIDIIVVTANPSACFEGLQDIGYRYKGEYNIPSHHGFNKREGREVNLHLYPEGHPEIELNLMFCEFLRTHREQRDQYSGLKKDLLAKSDAFEKGSGGFRGYTLGKYEFIKKILDQCGFKRPRILHCTHREEWKAVRALRESFGHDSKQREEAEENPPMLWCLGSSIKGIAQVISGPMEGDRIITSMALMEDMPSHLGKWTYVAMMEKWLRDTSAKRVFLSVLPEEISLWGNHGYERTQKIHSDAYGQSEEKVLLEKTSDVKVKLGIKDIVYE